MMTPKELAAALRARGLVSEGVEWVQKWVRLVESGRVTKRELPGGGDVFLVERFKPNAVAEIDADKGEVLSVITDESENRYRDIDRVAGYDFTGFRKNPAVLMDHDFSVRSVVGHSREIRLDKSSDPKRVLSLNKFTPDLNPEGRMVLDKIRAGDLRAKSVSWRALEWEPILDAEGNETGGYEFTGMDFYEESWVAVGANINSVAVDPSVALGIRRDVLDALLAIDPDPAEASRLLRDSSPGDAAGMVRILRELDSTLTLASILRRMEEHS
jgi:hypothetical protein